MRCLRPGGTNPSFFTKQGSRTLFLAQDAHGTKSGTRLIGDINPTGDSGATG